MSSSFIQIKPIGSQMGMIPWHNGTIKSQDFPLARRRVSCNLFGRPEKGAINETYRLEEKQRIEQFKQRYICFELDLEEPEQSRRPTVDRIAESRLGENLIEKELREHEFKLSQLKKTGACNEKLASDRIKSRTLKSEEIIVRTVVDSSKCNSSCERPKPYARQQSSITDFYTQRKTVVCNNSRTSPLAEVTSPVDEVPAEVLSPILEDKLKSKSVTSAVAAVSNNESSSSLSSSSTRQTDELEQSQEQISLHTMTTEISVKSA